MRKIVPVHRKKRYHFKKYFGKKGRYAGKKKTTFRKKKWNPKMILLSRKKIKNQYTNFQTQLLVPMWMISFCSQKMKNPMPSCSFFFLKVFFFFPA